MKMSVGRKASGKPSVAAADQTTQRVKTKGGYRSLPVMVAQDYKVDQTNHIAKALQCGHVTASWELITPDKAEKMLDSNDSNRKLRAGVAEQYARDMISGNWGICTTPLAFYENGDVADGQHRLWAVVDSGKSQQFIVLRGLKKPDGLNIDTGLGRTAVDGAHISGLDPTLNNNIVSASRSIEEGVATHIRSSNSTKLAIARKHREAAQFVVSYVRGKKIANGAVMGAVGRAWYKVDKEKLHRFCEVLTTGQSLGLHESAAVTLRNYLLSSEANLASSALWTDTFRRTQRCIKNFIKGSQMLQLRSVDVEEYPL